MKKKKQLENLVTYFEVIDALGGKITGDYMADLKRLNKKGKMCCASLYDLAYQMDQQQ